ncbi:MAG: hypothetical protein JWN43_4517 [Gammaproteobacteria bacterium]|nr:hypothetical protein [Gammaproteobacteria bacterium]
MHSQMKALLVSSLVPLLSTQMALRGDGVAVTITNDGAEDITVTVYDKSTNPQRLVLNNARINGFTSVPISLIADADGKAKLSWTAVSVESLSPKCGHADAVVSDAASVNVHVDSSCSA